MKISSLIILLLLVGCTSRQLSIPDSSEGSSVGKNCSQSSECYLPIVPWGLSSYGPYEAQCIQNQCKVIVGVSLIQKCNQDLDCNCSFYNPPKSLPQDFACSCIEQWCTAIVAE